MEYQKNKIKHKWKKTERPLGFQGYYVEVRDGEDAVRAYRKIKRWIKDISYRHIYEGLQKTGNYSGAMGICILIVVWTLMHFYMLG